MGSSFGGLSMLRVFVMLAMVIGFLQFERWRFQTQLEALIEKHDTEKETMGLEAEQHKNAAIQHKNDADHHRRVAEKLSGQVESHKKLADQLKAQVDVHSMQHKTKSSEVAVLQAKLNMRADAAQAELKTCRTQVAELKARATQLEKDLENCKKSASKKVVVTQDSSGAKCLGKQDSSHFCTPDVSDNKKWRKIRHKLKVSKMGGADRGNYQVPKTPHWYCDKLRSSLRPYKKPKTTLDDLAVAIFAGEQLYYGQVTAQRDTWLARVPGHHIFASTADPRIPVNGLKEKYGLKPDYVDTYVTQFTNLYALKELYLREPNRKWYFNYGCDNYINLDYMLEMLDQYDHTKDLWIGNYAVAEQLPGWVELGGEYPGNGGNKKHGAKGYEWVLGSTSWIMSNSVAKKFAENVEEFVKKHGLDGPRQHDKICYCPDRLSGLILSLLGFKVEVLKRKDESRFCSYNQDSIVMGDGQYDAGENIVYHFVSPRKMLAADQRAEHETLDRMVNAGDASQIVDRFRSFVDHHYYVLRRRQMEVKFLALEAGKHNRALKPNYGSPSPWNQYDDIPLDPAVEAKKMSY